MSNTKQPVWKLVANLGDVNPLEHGGYFVFEDTTGVYGAEAELLIEPQDDGETAEYLVYRFGLDRCTWIDGVLSDNEFHPNHPAWFADSLDRVASFYGMTTESLRESLCSENSVDRAQGYRAIGDYHGFENFDSYPLTLTRKEAKERLIGRAVVRG